MATLPALRVPVELESASFLRSQRQIQASVQRMGQGIATQNRRAQASFTATNRAVGVLRSGLVGLVGAVSVGAIARLGKAALDGAGGLGEMATQAGVTTRQLQILTVAGTAAGVSQAELTTSLARFGKQVGDALQGTGEFSETVEQYGLALKNSAGEVRSSVDILGDLADVVQSASSEQERLRIVQEAFGRSGAKLLPILLEGSDGFKEFAEQAEAAGLIISDKLIAQADRASDAIATLQLAAGTGFQIGVIDAFGDAIASSTDALRQAREAGEAFGQAVGTSLRAGAAAAAFLARNWREIVTVGSALVGLRLGAAIGGAAFAMVKLTGALRGGATAMAVFNSVVGKNVFVLLAKGILAAGTALATWLALTKAAESSSAGLAGELASLRGLFDDQAGGIAGVSGAAAEAAESLDRLLESAGRENEQLTALKAAHLGYGASVEVVTRTIEIDDALRAAKIPRLKAEESGLLALLVANQKLSAEIDAVSDAEKKRTQAAQTAASEQARLQEQQAARVEQLVATPAVDPVPEAAAVMQASFARIFAR